MRLTLLDMRMELADRPEFRFVEHDDDVTVGCYMIAGQDSFRDAYARECRGVVFNTVTGECVGRPLPKFFNVGELPETQPDKIDWAKLAYVYEKRDGSLIHTIRTSDGGFRLKTKKSFSAPQAQAALVWAGQHPHMASWLDRMVRLGWTVIMEWTAPDNRVVIPYKQEQLTVLYARYTDTGEFMPRAVLEGDCELWGIPLVESMSYSDFVPYGNHELLDLAKTVEEIEGWVLQFEDGALMKLKTQWYLDRHHYMTELRERDVARAVLNEVIDDIKTKIPVDDVHAHESILHVERAVVGHLEDIARQTDELFAAYNGQSRRDIAIATKDNPLFSLLMQRCSGKEPDFKRYYEKHHLDQRWGLDLVTSFGKREQAA